jgi:hypothetical protein
MQNMYMTPLRYKNFAGVEKTTRLHFHITPREFMDWAMDHPTEANDLIETLSAMTTDESIEEATTDQKYAMLRLVRTLAELGYGKPSDDGEHFFHDERFKHSAAYDAFRLFLFENPKEFVAFNETLLNEEVIKEFGERVAAFGGSNDEEKPAQPSLTAVKKDPKDMSREELLEAMQRRNQE